MSSEQVVHDREVENEFTTTHHVYVPHRGGLPPVVPYLRELWRRKEFATELSRATMRGANTTTFFGQLWLVINPLLLAGVYFLLVFILAGGHKGMDFFAQLCAGLFIFYFVAGSMSSGASSVVGGGKLLLNTAFPRLLMPFSAVRTAFFRYLPTLVVLFVFELIAGTRFGWGTLAALPFLFLIIVFALGVGSFFATVQVYFRDTTSFLPYFNRIWLYLSPILWTIDDVPARFQKHIEVVSYLNPLYSLIGGYLEALQHNTVPSLTTWLLAIFWAGLSMAVGSFYFMSREREFAVRI
ncbi:ABC transporter permease [Phycicoccus duodecadis]|uniref:Teichoic acid transport system permease protein n=1 Tax=Phycicoccus duodecadis TaxID=173053 RepID=A0A2N3YK49_9MICO|nr:ABC transporter permease [Phycicoccus duodecadis]PKW27230.1 teichoic acid transport system permease protein [Phycicoccus duodecadis]